MSSMHCAVIATPGQEVLARSAFDALSAQPHTDLRIHWHCRDGVCADYDAAVIPATAGSVESASREILRLHGERPSCTVIAVCQELTEGETVSLLAAGAFDFVSVPYQGQELLARVRRTLGLLLPPLRGRAVAPAGFAELIGSHPSFARQMSALRRIAHSDMGVLILGETGTGKELCAQAIHYTSARAQGPWVAVNCGAIPSELTESELFGHVKGAFTSAHAARPGLVRQAEGGTLFLDEIDSLPFNAQATLLRFLQEKEYRQVGSSTVQRADVRVIAASNRDLGTLKTRGTLREDLYFRLKVLSLTLPPLRERRDDIPRLAQHFLMQHSGTRTFAPQALKALLAHDWPGNVRELKHVIERAVVFADGALILPEHLDLPEAVDAADADSFRNAKERVVSSFERGYIENLLSLHCGNITLAARAAKKNRRAFFELIRKYGIVPQQYR